jgi:hypothetical protein
MNEKLLEILRDLADTAKCISAACAVEVAS